MKRLVVVDDRPWKLKDCIRRLKEQGILFYKTIYYLGNMISYEEQQELMAGYREITDMEVVRVDSQKEFLDEMDRLYDEDDVVFLMDYDLKGDMSGYDFFDRINVKYAREKDPERKKIWFYTSGPSDIKGLLYETFGDNVVSTPEFFGGQLYWDEEQVKAVAEV